VFRAISNDIHISINTREKLRSKIQMYIYMTYVLRARVCVYIYIYIFICNVWLCACPASSLKLCRGYAIRILFT